MTGTAGTQKLGMSGTIFNAVNNKSAGGVPTDQFERQPKNSAYYAEYQAMRDTLPIQYRSNDAVIDTALQQYFFGGARIDTSPNIGLVQKTQARMAAANQAVAQHTQALNAAEAPVTQGLSAQQAKLANLPGASTLSNPTIRSGVQALVNGEMAILRTVKPELAVAAQQGLSAGAALAYVASDYANPVKPEDLAKGSAPKPETPQPQLKPSLTPAAIALDTDHDGKLVCKEIGNWEAEKPGSKSKNAVAYQGYVTGRPNEDFHVIGRLTGNTVKFDGCKDTEAGPLLLEAKADHGGLLGGGWSKAELKNIPEQGPRQDKAATELGVRNEWHTQTVNDQRVIQEIFKEKKLPTPVIYSPMQHVPDK